jgi:hypothetical protein
MKKVSALLLTGIIGTSMLFADLSGTATFSHSIVDLENQTFGMSNDYDFDASIDLFSETSEAMGEGDVYASINATLTVSLLELSGDDIDQDTYDTPNALGIDDLDFDYDAYIMGDGWSLNISGVNSPVDYAADITALDDDDDAYDYAVAGNTTDGVALTIDDLGTFSLGIVNGDFTALTATDVYVAAETASMELSEGLTAQAGVSVLVDTAITHNLELGASAMVDYVMDDMAVSFAIDTGLDALVDFGMDAFLSVETTDLSASAYYGTLNANADFDFDDTDLTGLQNKVYDADGDNDFATLSDDDIYSIPNLLNVVVDYSLASFDVPVSVCLTALDLVNTQDLDVQIDYAVNDMLSPYVTAGYDIDAADWCAGAGVTYTTDMYTADASFSISDAGIVSAAASVESTTLVDGATLTVAWEDGDDLANGTLGTVTAYCEIDF